jgi:flavin-dependent dehydrogenase
VEYTPAASLRPECSLLYITNRAELDQWLAALRKAAEAELDMGNRITL